MIFRFLLSAIPAAFLLGCSAAGVPYTNDPNQKLEYAYYLMNVEGRGLPAEKLGKQALAQFEEERDNYGVAEAHHFLGTYYKSRVYRSYEDFYIEHNEYDPTAKTSILHYQQAIDAFEADGDYWGVSKSTFAMGNAFSTDNDLLNACIKYHEALEIYQSEKNVFKGRTHPHNQNFESYEAMIQAFIKAKCDDGV